MYNQFSIERFGIIPLGLIGILALVDIILKAVALWRSARNSQKYWFVALLLINSAGILPAIYLVTNKEKKSKKK